MPAPRSLTPKRFRDATMINPEQASEGWWDSDLQHKIVHSSLRLQENKSK